MKKNQTQFGFRLGGLVALQSAPILASPEYREAVIAAQQGYIGENTARFLRSFYKEFRAYNLPFVCEVDSDAACLRLVHPTRHKVDLLEGEILCILMMNAARRAKVYIEATEIDPLLFFAPGFIRNPPFVALMKGSRMTKKEMAKAKADMDLHVSLIMRREECTKAQALVRSWLKGPLGLAQTLGGLPFAEPEPEPEPPAK